MFFKTGAVVWGKLAAVTHCCGQMIWGSVCANVYHMVVCKRFALYCSIIAGNQGCDIQSDLELFLDYYVHLVTKMSIFVGMVLNNSGGTIDDITGNC